MKKEPIKCPCGGTAIYQKKETWQCLRCGADITFNAPPRPKTTYARTMGRRNDNGDFRIGFTKELGDLSGVWEIKHSGLDKITLTRTTEKR